MFLSYIRTITDDGAKHVIIIYISFPLESCNLHSRNRMMLFT